MSDKSKKYSEELFRISETYASDFSIDNKELMHELFTHENRSIAARVMYIIVSQQADSYKGKFPVLMDALGKVVNNTVIRARCPNDKADEIFWNLCKIAYEAHDHILIGYEMKLNDYQIAIYDALMGTFRESYNPRMLNVARSFATYLKRYPYTNVVKDNDYHDNTPWIKYLLKLFIKYDVSPIDEDQAFSYLFDEVIASYLDAVKQLAKVIEKSKRKR